MGAKWRVGDRKKIRVYGEQWLPGDSDSKVMSPISFLPFDAVVADLMDPQTGWWNSQVRRKCTFSPYILTFFHFSPYILFFPLLVPKSINAFHFSPFR